MAEFDEMHLCGFDTEACVYKTAMDLIEHNIRPIILRDYCYSTDNEMHAMGLKILEKNIGAQNIR
jgi:nicotinamidase-related amidase